MVLGRVRLSGFSGIVANFKDNRQLTTAEAWTCGLLYWFGVPPQQQVQGHH
jgi:hypothetical protein